MNRTLKIEDWPDTVIRYPRWFRAFLIGISFIVTATSLGADLRFGKPEDVGISTSRLERLDGIVEDAVGEGAAPGVVLLVARKGVVIYRKSFGSRAVEPEVEPMSLDSIFDVASLTKVMATATSVMMLVEEGEIALSRPVADYIPEFAKRGKSKVTVTQLLTHHSGLRPDLDLDDRWTGYGTALDLACRERLVEEPGAVFIYSDINYLLLGEMVARVSGMPLEEFARDRIYLPLGMTDTGFHPPAEKLSRVVPTDFREDQLLRGRVNDPTSDRMGGVAGHAGLYSTADDAMSWAQMILNGGSLNGVRILSPLAVLKMTTPQGPRSSPDWRGFGFDIATRFSTVGGDLFPVGSFGHTGYTGTSVWIDPFTETIVVLFTSRLHPKGEGDVVPLRSKVSSAVAASILDFEVDRSDYYLGY
jgi:CubicO group peptidase (beta-lactamase class C family)